MNAKIVGKFTCKGWFGRDKFYLKLHGDDGYEYTYNCWASDYFAFNIGDYVVLPS